jgi:hypothetical protein
VLWWEEQAVGSWVVTMTQSGGGTMLMMTADSAVVKIRGLGEGWGSESVQPSCTEWATVMCKHVSWKCEMNAWTSRMTQ